MPRTSTELKDLITEVEQPFVSAPSGGSASEITDSLRDRMSLVEAIVYTRYDYRKSLSPFLTNKIMVPASLLRYFKDELVAAMRQDLRFHLEPVGGQPRDETAADVLEVFEAHTHLDLFGGSMRDAIHTAQMVGFFWAGWLEMRDWKDYEPVKADGESQTDFNARYDREKKAFNPWHILQKHQESVAFMEQDVEGNPTPTLAVCRYKLPMVDLMMRFGKSYGLTRDDPDKMLKVYNDHFAWIRGDRPGRPDNTLDSWRNEVEVCVVDNGVSISHAIQVDRGTDGRFRGRTYRPVIDGEDYDNPFGQCSLLLAEGVMNYGQPLAYLREPFLTPMIQIENARALIKSDWASRATSAPRHYEQMPESVTQDQADMTDLSFVDDSGMPKFARTIGEIKAIEAGLDANTDKLYEVLDFEAQIASPQNLVLQQQARLAEIPATSVLASLDEFKQRLGGPMKSEANMINRVMDMVEHSMRHKLNKHRTKGEPKRTSDWPYSFTANSKERIMGRVVERGKGYEVTPQMLDTEFTREITPFDNREAAKSARRQEARERRGEGTILEREYLELNDIENVDEFIEKHNAEEFYRMSIPRIIEDTQIAYAQFEAIRLGRPAEEILQEIAALPVPNTDVGPAAEAGGGYQMQSPQTQEAGGTASEASTR